MSNEQDSGDSYDKFLKDIGTDEILPETPKQIVEKPDLPVEEDNEPEEIVPDKPERRREALIMAMDHAGMSKEEKDRRLEDFDKKNNNL